MSRVVGWGRFSRSVGFYGIFIAFAAALPPAVAVAQVPGNSIVTDGRTQTQIQVTGRTTNITTSTINGGNAYNSFSQFQLGSGNTANLYVPTGANDLINIVRNGTAVVNGTLNGYQNGAIGGNIFFADPYGFVVGAGGVINVGSLTVTTPSAQFVDRLISQSGVVDNAAASQLVAGAVPLSPQGVIYIRGQINAQSGVTLNGGVKVAIAGPRGATTPLVQRHHADNDKHWKLFEATVNTEGLQQGGSVVVQNGTIEIAAEGDASIGGTLIADGAAGRNAGMITATAGRDLTIASTAMISAKGQGTNSGGGHVKLDAGRNTTIKNGATINAEAGASGNGGKIELSATGTLHLGAATLDTGASNGAAGTVLIDPTNVIIGPYLGLGNPIPTQGSVDTNGGNVDITATNSISLEAAGYVNTRQTVASGGTVTANDTTDVSLGNSGNITLDAPSMTLNGQLNAFAINVPGTSFTSGTITLTGLTTATIGGNLPNFNTYGANLAINATGSITLSGGAYINSRETTFGAVNDTTAVSTGDTGSVTLTAPTVALNGSINAFALNATGANATAYKSGTITLAGLTTATIGSANLPSFNTHGANLAISANSIALNSGAYINTRATTFGATNDTAALSTGNSGSVNLTAPSVTLNGSVNAFALNTAGATPTTYASGTISLAGLTSAAIGSGGNLPSFNTDGAGLSISAGSIVLNSGAYINTRATSFGAANDTAALSTGDSGDITLTAPTVTLNGSVNAFVLNSTGVTPTAYTAGTISLAGLTSAIIGSGGNLPSFNTDGAGLAISAGSITLESDGYINTRATTFGAANDTSTLSTGDSGAVTLTAPTISVSGPINAFALNTTGLTPTTYANGAVGLVGASSGGITVNEANVTIGSAAQSYITSIVSNGGNIAVTGTSSVTLESDGVINAQNSVAGTAAIDLSAQAAGNSGNITLTAPSITFVGGINPENAPSNAPSTGALVLAGANNGHTAGTITLTGPGSFTFDATDPVYGAGANLAINASSAITLAAGGLIDMRGDGYATVSLTAPTITFATGINNTGGFNLRATPSDSAGAGAINLTASNGFILGASDPIKTLGADVTLSSGGGTVTLGAGGLIDATASGANAGDITLSAATVSFGPGINTNSGGQLLAGASGGFSPGTVTLAATNGFTLNGADPIKTLGANIALNATGGTITLADGGSLDSRLTGANAGNITFAATTIADADGINNGGSVAVLAGAAAGFTPGTISLTADTIGLSSADPIKTLGANLALTANTALTLGAGTIDTRLTGGTSTGNSGNISLTAPSLSFAGGINQTGTIQLLAGATGAFLPGTISLTDSGASGGFTFDSTDPVKSLGANIAFYAAGTNGSITLNSGGSIDSRTGTGSTLNSGTITLSAPTVTFTPGINTNSGGALLAGSNGAGAGAINLIATAPSGGFTVNSGDPIVGSGATIELIASGASSKITIASNGTVDAGTSGLVLSAPTVTIAAGATLIDSGMTLSQNNFDITSANSYALPGQNLTLDASGSIVVEAGGYISTTDSGGASGSITLNAPTIILNGGTTPSGYTVDAGAIGGGTAGDVTLTAQANTTPTYPGGIYSTTTSITLQNNASIRGANVSATANSTTDVNFSASAGSEAAGLAVELAEGLLAGINVNVLGATANASVDVQHGSSITGSGAVLLSSLGSETVSFPAIVIQGALLPGSLAILYGAEHATVATTVEGAITAGGNLTVAAYNNATVSLQAWADTNPLFNSGKIKSGSLYAGAVTVAYGSIATLASIAANATILATGQVAVLARNDNALDNEATALALGNSAVGFSVAVTDFTSTATATDAANLGTASNKVGGALIEADNITSQNAVKASTTTGANALQTVLLQLSAPGGAVGLGVGGGEALLLGAVIGSGIPQVLSTSSGSSSPIKVAATVAYANESFKATADIAGASGSVAPSVYSSGPVAVDAQVYDFGVRFDAQSSVGSAGPATANAISTGSSLSFSVALMLGFVDHDADAYIGPGTVVSGTDVGVGSSVTLPIDNNFVCAHNPCSFSEFSSHLNGNFGLANDLASTYVSASSQANVFGIAGAVDWVDFTNNSSAWIGDGAQVTSTATGSAAWNTTVDKGALAAAPAGWPTAPVGLTAIDWASPLTVDATTSIQTIDISGNICLSFNCTGGSSSGASSIGGSYAFVNYTDNTSAGIGSGVNVTASGTLTVAASDNDEAVTVSPTSGYGGANSLSGLVVMGDINNSTHASISSGAEVSAPTVNIDATQELMAWAITGGVTAGTTTGVGISVSIDQATTSTLAFVGDNSVEEKNYLSGLGLPYTPAVAVTPEISTNTLSVLAGSDGTVGAVSVAAALAISGPPSAAPPSGISAAFSSLTSLLNGNGLGFSSLGGAAAGAGAVATAPPEPTFGLAISGSAAVDQVGLTTEAYLKNATVEGYGAAANANTVTVQAINDTYLIAGSGAGTLTYAASPSATASAALAGAVAAVLTTNNTIAFIKGSTVDSDAVAVQALAGAAETAVAIGLSVNASTGLSAGLAFAGSVSVGILKDATNAYIDDSTVTGNSTAALQVTAYDNTTIGIGGGSLAGSAGGGSAFGVAVTYLETDNPSQSGDNTGNQVDAKIEGSTVSDYTTVSVFGLDLDKIAAGAATLAVSTQGTGFTGTASVNILNGTTSASIVNDGATASSVTGVGNVTVLASGDAVTNTDSPLNAAIASLGVLSSADVDVATVSAADPNDVTVTPGASIVGVAGSITVGKKSVGLSIVYNAINETRSATISDASITTDATLCTGACAVDVTANGDDSIKGFAIGVGVAVGQGGFSGAGSAVANIISNTTIAQIGNSTTSNTTINAPSVSITATDNATIESFAGQIAAAPSSSAAGAAIAYNKIGAVNGSGGVFTAAANRTTFTNTDSLAVSATSNGHIESAAIAGAAGSSVAFAGSFTTNFSQNTIDAALSGITYNDTSGVITVTASDTASIQSLAGSVSFGSGGAVGAGVAVNKIDDSTTAQIDGLAGTSIVAKDVTVSASAGGSIQTMAIGIAVSGDGVGGAGSIATNLNSENVTAEIDSGADVTAENNVGIIATNVQTMGIIAGAAGGGTSVIGAGLSLVVNDVTDTTAAQITGSTTKVDALGTDKTDLLTVNSGTLASVPGLVTLTPTATPPSLAETTTTVSGLALDATSEQGVTTNAVALGISADLISIGVSANIVTDIMSGSTKAHIDNASVDTRLTANPTIANYVGPQLFVGASSQGWAGNFVVSGAGGGYAGTAAAAGIRMERETDAYIDSATIGTLYTDTVTTQTPIGSVATTTTGTSGTSGTPGDGSTGSTTTIYQNVVTKTLVPSLGDVTVRADDTEDSLSLVTGLAVGFGGGGAGTVIVNVFSATTKAYVEDGTLNAASLTVTADTANGFSGNEGSGAGSIGANAVAGAFSVNVGNDTTLAYVGDPTGNTTTAVNLTGPLTVGATTEDTLNSVVVSVGIAGGAGVAAMADVTVLTNATTGSLYSVDLNTPATSVTTNTTDGIGNKTQTIDETAGNDVATSSGNVSVSAVETVNVTPKAGAGGGLGRDVRQRGHRRRRQCRRPQEQHHRPDRRQHPQCRRQRRLGAGAEHQERQCIHRHGRRGRHPWHRRHRRAGDPRHRRYRERDGPARRRQ